MQHDRPRVAACRLVIGPNQPTPPLNPFHHWLADTLAALIPRAENVLLLA